MLKLKSKKKESVGDRAFGIVNVLLLITVSLVAIYPFWHELCLSFSSSVEAAKGGLFFTPRDFTIDSYKSVLSSSYIYISVKNSVLTTVGHTILGLFFTATTAYPLARKDLPFVKFFIIMVVFTMVFNAGTIPTYLTVKNFGLIDSLWAMIIPGLIAPYNVIIMKNFFANIPLEIEESAEIDGANTLVIFFRIILPLSKAVLATVALWIAVATWNNYFSALLYLSSSSNYTLPLLIRDVINGQIEAIETGEVTTNTNTVIAATIMISTFPILCVYPFLQKHFVKGVMLGSVKG